MRHYKKYRKGVLTKKTKLEKESFDHTLSIFPPAANIDLASKITSLSVHLLHFLAVLMTNSSSTEF